MGFTIIPLLVSVFVFYWLLVGQQQRRFSREKYDLTIVGASPTITEITMQ